MPYKESKKVQPGIYIIVNRINKKVYIGQTWHLDYRWIQHKSKEHNTHLLRAFNQYGIESFEYKIIERLVPSLFTQDELNEKESIYIKQYDSQNKDKGYNVQSGGSGGLMLEETKKKLSKIFSGDKSANWKRIVSDEERKQMSNRMKGKNNPMYGRPIPEAIKIRYSLERRGKDNPASRSVRCIDTGKIYDTIKQASDDTGIGRDPISYVCHGKRKHAGKMKWEFV